ncbi:BTAD domain-containing putative transcriptional regulator [Knoellia sp. S7-12]|uniref:AfsR/SARP family transcriptional regulator n=1 Tax=Knoellia sp. S7-12 TaxID=3126698 RepID=UPI003365DD26
MEISMFGPLLVRDGERVLGPRDLGGVKPRHVLELLLLARGHRVWTDMMATALWSESKEPRNVVATINTYVCVLRHSMFDDQAQARRVIVTEPGAYRIALEEVDLDLDRFDNLVLRAERAPRQERLELLTAAVGLSSGPLLEDARYDEWAQEDRLVYEDRTTRAHLNLALDWLVEGERTACLRHAELALRRDRYSEEAYRLVMLANHGLGRQDAVRRAMGRCRDLLSRELGVACDPETERLLNAINVHTPESDIIQAFYPTALTGPVTAGVLDVA